MEAGRRRLEWALGVEPGGPSSNPCVVPRPTDTVAALPTVPGGWLGSGRALGRAAPLGSQGSLLSPHVGAKLCSPVGQRPGGLGRAAAAGWGSCLFPHGAGATPSTPAQPAQEARPLQNTVPAASPGAATHGSRPWSLARQAPLPSHDSAGTAASPPPARCPRAAQLACLLPLAPMHRAEGCARTPSPGQRAQRLDTRPPGLGELLGEMSPGADRTQGHSSLEPTLHQLRPDSCPGLLQ